MEHRYQHNLVTVLWVLISALGIAMLASCTVTEPVRRTKLQTWLGHHYTAVLEANGRPMAVYQDGIGGRVLVFDAVEWSVPGPSELVLSEAKLREYEELVWNSELSHRTAPTHIVQSHDLLYVDQDGYVYSFQSNDSDREIRRQWERNAVLGGVAAVVISLVIIASMEPEDY